MTTIYFTATGNSLYVAKTLGGERLSIPQLLRENRYHIKADKIGIITPVYGFDLPKIVRRFLELATFEWE